MGSCLSRYSRTRTAKDDDDDGDDHHRRRLGRHRDAYGRQDRASSTDEEPVVKEVLSETPKLSFTIPKAQPAKPGEGFAKPQVPPLGDVRAVGSADAAVRKAEVEPEPEPEPEAETELSEICSVSETVSVSTTFTDRGEMEEESRRRVIEHRSPNGAAAASGGPRYRKKRSLSGELAVPRREPRRGGGGGGVGGAGGRSSRSPARRLDAGGASDYGGARAFCGGSRDGVDRVGQPVGPRLGRRDPGERSGRRSVSPAAKRGPPGSRAVNGGPGTGNGPARVAPHGKGPGNRAPPPPPPRRHRAGELHDSFLENPAGKHPAAAAEAPPSEHQMAAAGVENGDDEETLENPLVALECFIFL